jgi:hypothetical protein
MLKRTLFILILAAAPLVWISCSEGFNDPNPTTTFVEDFLAPEIKLSSPLDSQFYTAPNLPIQLEVSDSFNLKSISIDLASIGVPAPGFAATYSSLSRSITIDTTYVANISDTVDFQMLIIASDSSGNTKSRTVKFKMIKP